LKVVDIKPFPNPVVGKVLGRPLFRDAINSMGDIVVWMGDPSSGTPSTPWAI
jgi:hypothetical protein